MCKLAHVIRYSVL